MTATDREVSESLPRSIRKSREAIIIIIPARHTDTEKPVIAIYSKMNAEVISIRGFFAIFSFFRSQPMPIERIARCIPLSARMWEMPIRLNASLTLLGRRSLSPSSSADSIAPVSLSVSKVNRLESIDLKRASFALIPPEVYSIIVKFSTSLAYAFIAFEMLYALLSSEKPPSTVVKEIRAPSITPVDSVLVGYA